MTGQEKFIQGIGIGEGLAFGPAFKFKRDIPKAIKRCIDDSKSEFTRFEAILKKVQENLSAIEKKLRLSDEEGAEIILAQLEFLDDPGYLGDIHEKIEKERVNAEFAVESVCSLLVEEFLALDDEYFRGRASDIQDISSNIIAELMGIQRSSLADVREGSVVVAEELLPSDTAELDPNLIRALCTEKGSATSHTALLARSLGIPAIVGLGTISAEAGEVLLVDAAEGKLWLKPSDERIQNAQKNIQEQKAKEVRLIAEAGKEAISLDGDRCAVYANISSASDARKAVELGAEGSGLLRSELFFYQEDGLPSEDRQKNLYTEIANIFGSQRPVTIRTLDIGGDKPLPSIQGDYADEQNPFLGLRGIRLTNTLPDVFQTQLRAVMAVASKTKSPWKIMFPFITTIDEVRALRTTMEQCASEHFASTDTPPQFGVMIEIPSAAIMIDEILNYVDFVSIGTNDLSQYTCAVDRGNASVASLADYHPSVFRLIKMVIDAGQRHKKDVSICGEMAGDPLLIPLFYGMGLRIFSMSAIRIPAAKSLIRKLQLENCKELLSKCSEAETSSELMTTLTNFAIDRRNL